MSVRVVARIRPLLNDELERDVIVRADTKEGSKKANMVKIPNPKNEAEEFSFTFNSVYDQGTTQEELFSAEGAHPIPTNRHISTPIDIPYLQSLHTSNPSFKASTSPYSPMESRAPARPTPCAEDSSWLTEAPFPDY